MRRKRLLGGVVVAVVVGFLLLPKSPAAASCGVGAGMTRADLLVAAADGDYEERSLDTVLVGVVTGTGTPLEAGDDSVPDGVFGVGVYTPHSVRVLADLRGGGKESVTVLVPGGVMNGVGHVSSEAPVLEEGAVSLIVGHRTQDRSLVIGSCTPSGTLTSSELSTLLAGRSDAVLYDQSLASQIAVTGTSTIGLLVAASVLIAAGTAMVAAAKCR